LFCRLPEGILHHKAECNYGRCKNHQFLGSRFFSFLTACVTSSQSIGGSSPCCGSGAIFSSYATTGLVPSLSLCSIPSVFAYLLLRLESLPTLTLTTWRRYEPM